MIFKRIVPTALTEIKSRKPRSLPPIFRPGVGRKIQLLIALLIGACSLNAEMSRTEAPHLALPWPTALENSAALCQVVGPAEFDLAAPPGTDLYISADGKYRINKSPRLLFRPDGPFILTAKIRPDLKAMWDAGALMLFNDEENFAKFCYERDPRGATRIVSVVCNGTGDDCSSMPLPSPSDAVYYRLTGSLPGNTFFILCLGRWQDVVAASQLPPAENRFPSCRIQRAVPLGIGLHSSFFRNFRRAARTKGLLVRPVVWRPTRQLGRPGASLASHGLTHFSHPGEGRDRPSAFPNTHDFPLTNRETGAEKPA